MSHLLNFLSSIAGISSIGIGIVMGICIVCIVLGIGIVGIVLGIGIVLGTLWLRTLSAAATRAVQPSGVRAFTFSGKFKNVLKIFLFYQE